MNSYRKQKKLIKSIEFDMKFINRLMYALWLNRDKIDEIDSSTIDILNDIMDQILKTQNIVYGIHNELRKNAVEINDITEDIYYEIDRLSDKLLDIQYSDFGNKEAELEFKKIKKPIEKTMDKLADDILPIIDGKFNLFL